MSEVNHATENGVKKTKTPRQYDSILKGALALSLEEKVQLKNALIGSITHELDAAKAAYETATKLAGS